MAKQTKETNGRATGTGTRRAETVRDDQALEKASNGGALSKPDFLKGGREGTDHITKADMMVPRLGIAQGMSPQVKRDNPKYIDGLQLGDMFNNLTGEILGPGPIMFHIVRADPPKGIEFFPRGEGGTGGGIKDFDVPPLDARMQFTIDPVTKKRVPPAATMFYEYVIVPVPLNGDVASKAVVLSMKSTQISKARSLNTFIKQSGEDLWAQRYSVKVVNEKRPAGDFYGYRIDKAGWVANADEYEALKAIYLSMKDRVIAPPEMDPDDPNAEREPAEM